MQQVSKTKRDPCFGVSIVTWPRLLCPAASHSPAPGAPRASVLAETGARHVARGLEGLILLDVASTPFL